MKINNLKLIKNIVLLAICTPLIGSCIPFMGDNNPPIPQENPLYISKEAQTVVTTIKNLSWIKTLYPDTDKETINNVITDTEYMWILIESEWITLYQNKSPKDHEKVEITVKENNTGESRTYTLSIGSKMKESTLTIIQNAN